MSDPEPQASITPAQIDTITFYGHKITAVRLEDGRVGAVFTDLCAAIGLDRASQVRRIRQDDTIADQLVTVQVDLRDAG